MKRPPFIHQEIVSHDWVDYNGHMNVAYYVLIFDHATDVFLADIGINERYRQQTGGSVFVVESHISYEQEVMSGETVNVTAQVIDTDEKRLHLFLTMWGDQAERPAATIEIMILHMNLNTRRPAAFPNAIKSKLDDAQNAHTHLPRPNQLGRQVNIRKKE